MNKRLYYLLLTLIVPTGLLFAITSQTAYGNNGTAKITPNQLNSTLKPASLDDDWFYSYELFSDIRYGTGVAVGNFNGDGRNDVVAAGCFITCTLNILLQTNDNELVDSGTTFTYINGGSDNILVADLNNDNLDDIAVIQQFSTPESIKIFFQGTNTTFTEEILTTDGYRADAIAAGDFNNDGLTDLAASFFGASVMGVFLQDSSNVLQAPTFHATQNRGFHDMDTGDFNDDGLIDIVQTHGAYGYLGASVTVFLQNDTGSLDPAVHYDIDQSQDYYVNSVTVGDVNNDGLDDILTQSTRGLSIFEQDLTGLPNIPTYYDGYCNPSDIEVGDVNLDGLNDVLTVGDGCGELALYEQENSNTLSSYETYPIGYGGSFNNSGLAVDDINSDGKPDAILGMRSSGLAILYHSDPDFAIEIAPEAVQTTYGTNSITFTMVISRLYNFTDTVSLALVDLPTGVTHNLPSGPFTTPYTFEFSLSSIGGLAPVYEPYTIEIVGTSGSLTHAATANFTILHRQYLPFVRSDYSFFR